MNFNLTLIMQAVAFTAFIWFCARFIWPPLMRAIETRQKQIADGLAAGEQGRKELASAEKRDAEMLAEAKARSAEIVAIGEKFKAETIEQAKIDAKAEADRIIAAAKAEIEQEVARAKEQLRDAVADLAVAGAAKILKKDVDAQGARRAARAAEARTLSDADAMAELTTIARPYAEAAFSLAREQQRAAGVVADAAAREPRRRRPAGRARRSTIRSSTRREGIAAAVDLRRRAQRRRPQLRARAGRGRPDRAAAGDPGAVRDAEGRGRRRGQGDDRDGVSARRQRLAELTAALERRFGRKIEATVVVKPELIGGARITVGDNVIDGTVQEQLRAMADAVAGVNA